MTTAAAVDLDRPRAFVGRELTALPTPALLLHLEVLEQNIATMAGQCRDRVAVRPHAKVHKSPEIARRQMAAGAIGVTVATVAEAVAMVAAGVPSVLLANEIADPGKIAQLTAAAEAAAVWVAIDSHEGAIALAQAAAAHGVTLNALIEVDIGMTRGGVRSPEKAQRLAERASETAGLELRGVMGWEGHTATMVDRQRRERKIAEAIDLLLEAAARLEAAGIGVDTVSAGGTNTYEVTGMIPGVTEIQAGTYALMDTSYQVMAPHFEPALGILGTVVSRHGERAVLDCGTKVHASTELAPPGLRTPGGRVFEVHEEHTLLSVSGDDPYRTGAKVELVPSYCSGTVNLHDFYYVCSGGTIVDVWPIVARGAGVPG